MENQDPGMQLIDVDYNEGDAPTGMETPGQLFYNNADDKLYTVGAFNDVLQINHGKEYRTYKFNIGGWNVIAETSVGRTVSEFEMYDGTSSRHQYIRFIASALYGQDKLSVIHRNSYNKTAAIADDIRICYNVNERTYGGAQLQVWVADTGKPVNFSMKTDQRLQYEAWKFLEEPASSNISWDTGAVLYTISSMRGEWVYPSMSSGFVNYGGGYTPCRWRRDIDNKVTIEFMIKGAANGLVFTLPEGARPDYRLLLPSVMSGGHGRVDVASNGQVTVMTGSTSWNGFSCTFTPGRV